MGAYLGDHWVRLERITDAAHCLRLDDTRQCEVMMDDFERVFPQAFFAVYLGMLPTGLNVAELGFWLLNQGAFNTPLIQKRNDFGVVMVVDPVSKNLAVSLGYAIEGYFDPKTLNALLHTAGEKLRAQEYAAAITVTLQRVMQVLRGHARPKPWSPEVSHQASTIAVEPLRGGHRVSTPSTEPGHMAGNRSR
ncbi:MAG: TPM domain-containing protein [Verrucomicrobiaceae bacterium]|nr:TPM domain-containing protein [Verrucomicrobiaceae bacterium]